MVAHQPSEVANQIHSMVVWNLSVNLFIWIFTENEEILSLLMRLYRFNYFVDQKYSSRSHL